MIATSVYNRFVQQITYLLLLISFPLLAQAKSQPVFYQLNYQGSSAYLLGSIHIGKASFFPLPSQIENAFQHSGALVVEADVSKVNIGHLLREYGMKKNAPQFDVIDKELVKIRQDYCQEKLEFCHKIKVFQPWLQSMQISVARYIEQGYSPEFGTDQYFINNAQNKPIYELEGAEEQFQLLSSFSVDTQWSMLKEAMVAPDEDLHDLVNAWQLGDETALANLMENKMIADGDQAIVEKLLWQRNKSMARKIKELMQANKMAKPIFIIVGAGHLVGRHSVQYYLLPAGISAINCWKNQCR